MAKRGPVRPRAFWEKLVAEYRKGGVTREKLCAAHGVTVSGLSYWVSKLNEETKAAESRVALVPVKVSSPTTSVRQGGIDLITARVGEIRFTFPVGTDPSYLASLVAWTERARC